jgi:hypothetical protein
MVDYYDRLETQLAELTASGAHRRRWTWRGSLPRMRLGLVAVVAAVLLVVAVGAVLLSAGTSHRASHQVTKVRPGPPVVHNYYPGALPPPSGQLICNADLEPPGTPPGIQRRRHGMVIAYDKPPTGSEFTITATGLKPNAGGDVYAVWVLAAVSLTSGGYQVIKPESPQLLGVIKPGVGSSGKLAAQGVAPGNVPPVLELVLTRQPQGSLNRLGRIVLSGFALL